MNLCLVVVSFKSKTLSQAEGAPCHRPMLRVFSLLLPLALLTAALPSVAISQSSSLEATSVAAESSQGHPAGNSLSQAPSKMPRKMPRKMASKTTSKALNRVPTKILKKDLGQATDSPRAVLGDSLTGVQRISDLSAETLLLNEAKLQALQMKDAELNFSPLLISDLRSPVEFAQAFPNYFFEVIKNNLNTLRSFDGIEAFTAWTPGRAYPESFGALIRGDAASIFTVSDVESAGPGPCAASFFQFLVGARFYDSSLRVDLMLQSYMRGIEGEEIQIPHLAMDLLSRSRSKGMVPDEARVMNGRLLREPGASELSAVEQKVIQANLDQFFPRKVTIIDGLQKRQETSFGKIQKHISLLLESRGQTLAVDLEEETPSANLVFSQGEVALGSAPKTSPESTSLSDRLTTAFTVERGGLSVYEGAIQISGVRYTMMPHFRGDIAVQINNDGAQGDGELTELFKYEAYTLGQIHARTLNEPHAYLKALARVAIRDLARDVVAVGLSIEHKFAMLHGGLKTDVAALPEPLPESVQDSVPDLLPDLLPESHSLNHSN